MSTISIPDNSTAWHGVFYSDQKNSNNVFRHGITMFLDRPIREPTIRSVRIIYKRTER